MIKEVEFIVSGEVQGVGYRQYVAKLGRKLKLVGFAENLEDGTVRIHCKGEEKAVSELKKLINVKKPDAAPLINVEEIRETPLTPGTVTQTIFKEKYGDTNAEMAQGFSTGMNYMNLLGVKVDSGFTNLGVKVDVGFAKTDERFGRLDEKYDKISQAMFAVVSEIKETNKIFETRIEKTDKNIESLLKVLAQKKI